MNFISDAYKKSLYENEKNLHFWESYLQNLKSLDFSTFANYLKVPILVPIGSRLFFQGELKHTSEITVSLGADYFTQCSLKHAEKLRQHRIRGALSKIEELKKEKIYLENQLLFKEVNAHENQGHEIIEEYSEEEDKTWRKKHREKLRVHKQTKDIYDETSNNVIDEKIWERLEELELQEELEEELANMRNVEYQTYDEKETDSLVISKDDVQIDDQRERDKQAGECNKTKVAFEGKQFPTTTMKLELLKEVLTKQNLLDQKLSELRNRESAHSKTASDLISKLDEMEQLDELEDEINRLDDVLLHEGVDVEELENINSSVSLKRCVSFVDEDTSDTLEIIFKHSDIIPSIEPYNPQEGIQKPSDIYTVFKNLFSTEIASILKKSKCENRQHAKIPEIETNERLERLKNETIEVSNIVEKYNNCEDKNKLESNDRPVSIFKKRRQHNK